MWANDQLSNELKAYYVPEDRKPKEAELLTAETDSLAGDHGWGSECHLDKIS